jgi:hypothetical protein
MEVIEMSMIDKALDRALDSIFGPRRPRILIIVGTVGRSGLDTIARILRRGGAQGVLILIGDPITSYEKLLQYNLTSLFTSIVRTAISRYMIILVDNGLKRFALRGDDFEVIEARDPDEKGSLVNEALRDNPIILYAAHALSRGISLSHVGQLRGVYVMSQAIEAICPRGVGDYELLAELFTKLHEELCVLASFINNPARRKTVCFWYGFNLDDPNAVEANIHEELREVFKIGEEDLYLIGGSNSCPENPSLLFKPKCAFDSKYMVSVLLFGVDPKEDDIGPQFAPVKQVWEEKRKTESSKLLRPCLRGALDRVAKK